MGRLEDGKGDGRKEDGRSSLTEIERDGRVLLPAAAAVGVRQLQELRGPVARGLHGRERRGDAWEGGQLRAQGGGRRWRQEEVRGQSAGPVLPELTLTEFLCCG